MLPRLESPPKLSTKQVTEPGNCPNLSSEISCRPLPFAGNSEDLVQHLGRKEADLLPCTGLARRQETRQGGVERLRGPGERSETRFFHLQDGLSLATFPSQKDSLTPPQRRKHTSCEERPALESGRVPLGGTPAHLLGFPQGVGWEMGDRGSERVRVLGLLGQTATNGELNTADVRV